MPLPSSELDLLRSFTQRFCGMTDEHFALSVPYWEKKHYTKGSFFNEYKNVCTNLGFILDGLFRAYYVHADTGEERNVFFFSEQQIIVSYKSFLDQLPCTYHTECLRDSAMLYISFGHLQQLYKESHQWERFGRMVAEFAYHLTMARMEDFLFQTPEQRYLDLLDRHPNICNQIPLYHISSYLGIQGPSLSRIRKRMASR